MDERLTNLDWTQVQAFLAVAETGSLSAGARKLGVSQPTLGRHVRALEESLKIELFRRQPKGLTLTDLGEALLPAANAMREAAHQITLAAAGQDAQLEGTVRITASVMIANTIMPPVIADLRRLEPGIQIELVSSDSTENLIFQEADIALRMFEPRQQELVARKLGQVEMGIFAARAYLDRVGWPSNLAEALQLDLVGYDTHDRILTGMQERGIPAKRSDFPVRCDDLLANWALVRAGCGVGFGLARNAVGDPALVRLLPEVALDALPAWLVTHPRMRHVPRMRRVWDHLSEALPPLLS